MATTKDNVSRTKIAVQARIDPDALAKLDGIAESMLPRPTRSEMIDAAVREYVDRRTQKKTNR